MVVPEGIQIFDFMGNEYELDAKRILPLSGAAWYFSAPNYETLVRKLENPQIDQTDYLPHGFGLFRQGLNKGIISLTCFALASLVVEHLGPMGCLGHFPTRFIFPVAPRGSSVLFVPIIPSWSGAEDSSPVLSDLVGEQGRGLVA